MKSLERRMKLFVYGIRHKPTGVFMPTAIFRSRARGWSCWTPYAKKQVLAEFSAYNPAPRLFFTRKAAQNAIGQWQRGVVITTYNANGEDSSRLVKDPQRNKSDLEIVTFTLTESENG